MRAAYACLDVLPSGSAQAPSTCHSSARCASGRPWCHCRAHAGGTGAVTKASDKKAAVAAAAPPVVLATICPSSIHARRVLCHERRGGCRCDARAEPTSREVCAVADERELSSVFEKGALGSQDSVVASDSPARFAPPAAMCGGATSSARHRRCSSDTATRAPRRKTRAAGRVRQASVTRPAARCQRGRARPCPRRRLQPLRRARGGRRAGRRAARRARVRPR